MKLERLRSLLASLIYLSILLPSASGYVRATTQDGLPLSRTDFANIQFLVNDATAAGMLNTDGQPIITADSDPMEALRASLTSWSNIASSAVQFADLQTTNLVDDGNDNQHVFIFTDTQDHRDVVGGALGITLTIFSPTTGELFDTDIVFNPTVTFSTNQAQDTFDLQGVATHEVGHALGANHTGILGAAMFQSTLPQATLQANPTSDDVAFLTSVYPAPGAENNFGTISGTVSFEGGGPVRGALIVALDASTGVHCGGLSSTTAGTYTITGVPPGEYGVYAEPADGPVLPVNLRMPDNVFDVAFHTGVFGGFEEPVDVNVVGGGEVTADITVEPGNSAVDIDLLGVGSAGGSGDASFARAARLLTAGQALDLMLWGQGLDDTITENDIFLVGPGLSIRPGTLRIDQLLQVNGRFPLRMTVDVGNPGGRTLGTIAIIKGTDAVAYSGSLVIVGAAVNPVFTAAGLVNSASFLAGPLAPDSWADLFGENLAARFMLDSSFPTLLDGTSITITDSQGGVHQARLHFVDPNRIQFLMPPNMAPGPATLTVTNSTGGSTTVGFEIATVAPGLFSANASGQGPAAATFLRVAGDDRTQGFTFTLDVPRVNVPIDLGPATDQVFLSFFGTGFRFQTSFSAQIGGIDVPVFGAVAQGQFEALDQAVVGPLPRSLAGVGEADVVFFFDGIQANTVTVNIR